MRRLFSSFALCCTVLLTLVGCGSYRLGSGETIPFKTLFVEPVINRADLPQAVGLYSTELRQAFLRDGRVTLVNRPEEADAILSVTLETYRREATASREDDTRLARKFDLEVQAVATLKDTRQGKAYFESRALRATRQIYTTATTDSTFSRQQQAEFTTQPLLARELAERTKAAVLDTW